MAKSTVNNNGMKDSQLESYDLSFKLVKNNGGGMSCNLTHAKLDTAYCLAPGLFRCLKKGDRKKLKLDITYHYSNDCVLRFVGFEPLDAKEMRLLHAFAAMAGVDGRILSSTPQTPNGTILRQLLNTQLAAKNEDVLVVETTLANLMRELGYLTENATTRNAIKASLLRMANVTMHVSSDGLHSSSQLLSYRFRETDGALLVALNPRATQAVLGKPFTRIDYAEVQAIKSDPTRIIHQRLCAWLNPGKTGKIALHTICDNTWPDAASAETLKKRKQTARKALMELSTLGWKITNNKQNNEEIIEITRPSLTTKA